MAFRNYLSEVSVSISQVSRQELVAALKSAKYIADGNPSGAEYYDDVNLAAAAIVEPEGVSDEYWDSVEDDNYDAWINWIAQEFGEDWKAIAIHVRDDGY